MSVPPPPTPPRARKTQASGLATGSDVEIAGSLKIWIEGACGSAIFAEGDFWHYDVTHWQPISGHVLRAFVHRYDGKPFGQEGIVRLSRSRIDSILHELASMCAVPDFFESAQQGINCQNGFIRFDQAGQPVLEPHHPDQRSRHTLKGSWQPDTSSALPGDSLLYQLLHGVFRGDADGQEKINLIAEICGSAALGYATRLKKPKAVILLGTTAENGKSQILDLVRSLLPSSAVSAISPADMADEKYRVLLVGKLLNARDELSGAKAVGAEMFKAVITGDPLSAGDLYKSVLQFRATAQHVFATNELPRFSGGIDRGVQRRLLVLPFNRVISVGERIESIGRKIGMTEPDLLLAFAVEGASRLISQGAFTEPDSSQQALGEWLADDPVLGWLKERVTVRPTLSDQPAVRTRDAFKDFEAWAFEEGRDPQTLPPLDGFTRRVKGNAPPGITYKRKSDGRYFVGMVLRKGEAISPPGPHLQVVRAAA